MTDQIDLHTVECIASPPVADWPITVAITGIDMDLHGGLTLSFDRPLPESWKFPFNPENSADNVQFTVGAVVQDRYAAGFVQMWQGRTMGDRSLPPILAGYQDWWGDPRHLWGPMSDYVPRAGDRVGFFVSAGNGRLTTAVTSVAERSNVVVVLTAVRSRVVPFRRRAERPAAGVVADSDGGSVHGEVERHPHGCADAVDGIAELLSVRRGVGSLTGLT
jgi:hypothetical protein